MGMNVVGDELDQLLESGGFAADANDPGEAGAEVADLEDVTGEDLELQAGADADEEAADELDPASAAEAPEYEQGGQPASAEAEQLRQYAGQLEVILQQQAELQRQSQRQTILSRLEQMRDSMTDEEWTGTQARLIAQWSLHLQRQMKQQEETRQMAQVQAAESDAREYAIQFVTQRMRLSKTEQLAIRNCPTPAHMQAVVEQIKENRRDQTEAARRQARENRLATGVDRVGGTGRGGAKAQPQAYASLDEIVDSIFA